MTGKNHQLILNEKFTEEAMLELTFADSRVNLVEKGIPERGNVIISALGINQQSSVTCLSVSSLKGIVYKAVIRSWNLP